MRKYPDFKYIMPLLKNVTKRGLQPTIFNKVSSNIKCYVMSQHCPLISIPVMNKLTILVFPPTALFSSDF